MTSTTTTEAEIQQDAAEVTGEKPGFSKPLAENCTCCGKQSLHAFEKIADLEKRVVDIAQCAHCGALVNIYAIGLSAIEDDANTHRQTATLERIYSVNEQDLPKLQQDLKVNESIVSFFIDAAQIGDKASDLIALELGVGKGLLTLAAGTRFKHAYGQDLRMDFFHATLRALGKPENVTPIEQLSELPGKVDAILMWHTLEHIPAVPTFIRMLMSHLNPGGHIFFQVPMYRPPYVVKVHYTFFNERAVRVMANDMGLETVGVFFDTGNGYLTALLRKPV